MALTGWVALSSAWAVPGALVEGEVRRAVVYACALAALLLTVDGPRREPLLLGLLGGISLLGAVAIVLRASSGEVVDRFYGTLLEEPVGYPNAMGALAALGITLAVGLARGGGGSGIGRSAGSATLLVLVLGLSGSRGARRSRSGVGLCVLVALRAPGTRVAAALAGGHRPRRRRRSVGRRGPARRRRSRASRARRGGGARRAGSSGCRSGWRRDVRWSLLAASASIAVGRIAVAQPIATTSSFRSAYWAAALDEARARPALGSGAGSFHLTWGERGREGLFVRDAHSLYVEALSELGPVGLALVLAIVAIPIATAVRRRGEPLVAVSGAAFAVFAVHAGLDWDWEMPVVTLAALGLLRQSVLTRPSDDRQGGN